MMRARCICTRVAFASLQSLICLDHLGLQTIFLHSGALVAVCLFVGSTTTPLIIILWIRSLFCLFVAMQFPSLQFCEPQHEKEDGVSSTMALHEWAAMAARQ